MANADEFKKAGIDEVIVYCVNDGAVMKGWAKDLGIKEGRDEDQLIKLFADTRGEFTQAIGMFMNHPGPKSALGNDRCKRFVLICENGIVKNVEVSEAPDDPAGDNDPKGDVTKKTLAETILELVKK